MSQDKKTREEIIQETLDYITPIVEKYSHVIERADKKEIESELAQIENIMDDTSIPHKERLLNVMVTIALVSLMANTIDEFEV